MWHPEPELLQALLGPVLSWGGEARDLLILKRGVKSVLKTAEGRMLLLLFAIHWQLEGSPPGTSAGWAVGTEMALYHPALLHVYLPCAGLGLCCQVDLICDWQVWVTKGSVM